MPTSKKLKSKNNKTASKSASKKSTTVLYAVVIVILLALLSIFIVHTKTAQAPTVNVESLETIKDKLGIEIIIPSDAKNVSYALRGNEIGVVEYDKTVSNGNVIHYILSYSKTASNQLEYIKGETWGTPIEMNVDTKDGKKVLVTSNVSSDDKSKMQGKWTDNEVFYSMATETLTAREDFLQEVNRLVKNNHK